MLGTALVVDIHAIRRLVNNFNIGAEFGEGIRRHPVGRAVGGIQGDLQQFNSLVNVSGD